MSDYTRTANRFLLIGVLSYKVKRKSLSDPTEYEDIQKVGKNLI